MGKFVLAFLGLVMLIPGLCGIYFLFINATLVATGSPATLLVPPLIAVIVGVVGIALLICIFKDTPREKGENTNYTPTGDEK